MTKYLIIKNPEAQKSRYFAGNDWLIDKSKAIRFDSIGDANAVRRNLACATADVVSE